MVSRFKTPRPQGGKVAGGSHTPQPHSNTLQLTKDIQEDSETMVKALDEKKDFIINARSNLADLPEATKRKLDSLERDIERYSVDLEKIKALVKKLEKHKNRAWHLVQHFITFSMLEIRIFYSKLAKV